MIQRIQSIFLLLAAAFFFLEFAFPFFSSDSYSQGFFTDYVYNIQDHPALLTLTIAAGIISLIAIVMYKNRSLQTLLVYLSIILAIALTATMVILLRSNTPEFLTHTTVFIGSFLPFLAIIFLGLSLRNIKKDDKLVKSMDRLR